MQALALNCTLKRSPDESNTAALAQVVLDALAGHDVDTELVRVVDHVVEPGVVSEAVTDDDEWPALREKIAAADILVLATPTWLGQPSSIGAHHVIAEIAQGLIDLGYTVPAQAWTYWNKGPGPGDEEYVSSDETEWSDTTGRTAAQNLHAVARALAGAPLPRPAS